MSRNPLLRRLKGDSRFMSWDYRVAGYVAALTAAVSLFRLTFRLGYNYGTFESSTANHITCCIGFVESVVIVITAGVALIAFGLWLRNRAGLLLSFIASLCVLGFYYRWYSSTVSALPRMEVTDFSQLPSQQQYLIPLLDATSWDLAVLAVVTVLFFWHIKNRLTAPNNL
jgi:hypothetical protein